MSVVDDLPIEPPNREVNRGVRVDYRSHPQILMNRLATALILGSHDGSNHQTVLDLMSVLIEPEVASLVRFRGSVFASIKTEIDVDCG